jgi:hypothetical protein
MYIRFEVGVENETTGLVLSTVFSRTRFFGVSNCNFAKLSWSMEDKALQVGEFESGDEAALFISKHGVTNMV